MGNGRTRRADLFFHPPPAAPLPLILPRTRRPLLLWTGFAVAVVIAGAIARWLDTAMAREAGLVVGTTVLLAGMAAYVALNLPTDINRRRQLWHDGRLTGQTWEHWTGEPDREFAKPNSYRFGRRMRDVLLRSFYHAAADRAVDVKEWIDDTEGIRRTLCSEMAEQFSYRSKLPATRSVEWLANHHAHRYLSMWRAGGFATRDEQEKARPWLRPGVHLVAPLVTAGGSVLTVLLPRGVAPPAASLLTIALVVALLTAATCARSAVVLQSTRAYIDSEFAQRHRTETAAYEAWSSRLADRPSDSEISEWLDHDKLHVKATAMRQYGLSNRDLLDHFFVVGSGTGARSARVAHGPPRYTDYEIWLFLLTSAGVRQMKVQLELRTGDLTDEERMSFRYDAITAAYVVEKALRPGSASATDDDDDRSAVFRAIRAIRGKLVLHQLFRLTLNNNDEFSLPLANFDESLWEKVHDDPERIAQLTRDASGAEAALRILEGIAGEGSAWVEQEKARRRRTVRYHGRDRERLALTSASPEEQP